MAIYAEKYFSYHTINMYKRFKELVIDTNLKVIDVPAILNWKAILGKNEWYLGTLKGFYSLGMNMDMMGLINL